MKFYNIKEKPIEISGLLEGNIRLPTEIAEQCNEAVIRHYRDCAGGKIRFATDSEHVYIKVDLLHNDNIRCILASSVDFYFDGVFSGIVNPVSPFENHYEGERLKQKGKMVEVELGLPNYDGIVNMEIGVDDDATVLAPAPYKYEKPIVFYGSSITQGGWSSHNGNCYAALVCRALNANYRNLGFSGGAKGEKILAEYISNLDMTAFVLDYDHNAPNLEHLKDTHKAFFDTVRAKNPTLPILIMSKPDFDTAIEGNTRRREVIMQTYLFARQNGDKNVYFCDGRALFDTNLRDACTFDTCHPNDLGFYRMAQGVYRELSQILK